MDQVFITNLVTRAIIGINDSEREKPQEIRIKVKPERVTISRIASTTAP
jgi:dihydroneopterin aldolase